MNELDRGLGKKAIEQSEWREIEQTVEERRAVGADRQFWDVAPHGAVLIDRQIPAILDCEYVDELLPRRFTHSVQEFGLDHVCKHHVKLSNGETWTLRTLDSNTVLAIGDIVTVRAIDGATAVVAPIEGTAS